MNTLKKYVLHTHSAQRLEEILKDSPSYTTIGGIDLCAIYK